MPSEKQTPGPSVVKLAAAGIPTVSQGDLNATVAEREERRDLLRGFLDSERRDWP